MMGVATGAQGGSISGTVTKAAGGPVQGLNVAAHAWNESEGYWEWVRSASTGATGNYFITGLVVGTYRVCFGDSNGDVYAYECYEDAANPESGTDVAVTETGTTAGINAQLAYAGRITGIVTNAVNSPVSGISVLAQSWNPNGSYWQWVRQTSTASGGGYDLGGLRAGSYRVCFYGWNPYVQGGQYCDSVSAGRNLVNNVTVTAGGTTSGVNTVAADTPPPEVVRLQPADGAAGVPVDQPLVVQFDRSMEPNCRVLLDDWFGGPDAIGQTTWSQTTHPNDTLTFVPAAPLRYSMGYELRLSQCRDANGVTVTGYDSRVGASFSTVGSPGDSSAPQVTSTSPYPSQVGGDSSHIYIVFNKPIDLATVDLESVLLTGPGAPTYRLLHEGGFLLDIRPQGLRTQTQYQVALTPAVADAEGHGLAAPYSFAFNTGAGDTTAPTITQTRPADQAPGLEWEPIRIFFSENMDPDTLVPATVRVFDETAGNIPVDIHIDKSWVAEDFERASIEIYRAFEQGGRWQSGHSYRVELGQSISDLAGNELDGAREFGFTVASWPNNPPSIWEGDSLAYRQPDGRVTLKLAFGASSSIGGSIAVSVEDLSQPGKRWDNLVQEDGEYVYRTPDGMDEGLATGPHRLNVTVTDQSNSQSRTLLWTIHVLDKAPLLNGGPADGASGVSLQPTFAFSTNGVGGALYWLAVMDDASGDTVFSAPIFPKAGTSYSLQIPRRRRWSRTPPTAGWSRPSIALDGRPEWP